MTIREYAVEQVAQRLRRVAFEMRRARKKMDDEAVHDLRVSVRRLAQSLRLFSRLLPSRQARRVRRELRSVMKLAGEVRNLDVAREMIVDSKLSRVQPLLSQMAEQRQQAQRDLTEALGRYRQRDFTTRWRERLQLEV